MAQIRCIFAPEPFSCWRTAQRSGPPLSEERMANLLDEFALHEMPTIHEQMIDDHDIPSQVRKAKSYRPLNGLNFTQVVPWRLRKFRNYSSVEKKLCLL
jgi:hypothetical protein